MSSKTLSKVHVLPNSHRGFALPLSLLLVLLLCVLVAAVSNSAREERTSSNMSYDAVQAEWFAREASEWVKATLAEAAQKRVWISAPGRLYVTSSTSGMLAVPLDLFSGVTGTGSGVLAPPNLNRVCVSSDGAQAITGKASTANPALNVGWVYVYKSGTRSTLQNPAISTADPIIGRFAYWADDESSRVDLNTAYDRSLSTDKVGYPSRVGLFPTASLSGVFSNATQVNQAVQLLHNAVYSGASPEPLRITEEIASLDPIASLPTNAFRDLERSQRWALTIFNHSSDLNPWGDQKIVLTTQKSLAGNRSFLDILNSDNIDPGLLSNVNKGKALAVISTLSALLSRTDWPYGQGSLASKYTSTQTATFSRRLAVDIIEMVRCAESPHLAVEAMRFSPDGTATNQGSGVALGTIVGNVRSPLITEIGFWLSNPQVVSGATQYTATTSIELHFPTNYAPGVGSQNILSDLTLPYVSLLVYTSNGGTLITQLARPLSSSSPAPSSLTPGGFSVLNFTWQFNPPSSVTSRPSTVFLRAVLYNGTTSTPLGWGIPLYNSATSSNQDMIPYTLEAVGLTAHSVQISDPRTANLKDLWVDAPKTFGAVNSNWSQSVSASPPQDISASTNVNDLLRMPAPKNTASNSTGILSSVADLGSISTGIISGATIPWRSLRFRPYTGRNASSPPIPDWAIFDLFQTPGPPSTDTLLRPYKYSMAGRVNLHAQIPQLSGIYRYGPLQGLLYGIKDPSGNIVNTTTIATAIFNHTLATNGVNYGPQDSNNFHPYVSPGEVAEVSGVCDSDEKDEQLLGQFIDNTTVRGEVFRVFSLGQTLRQTPAGNLVVTAECNAETVLEMIPDTANPTVQIVRWRRISF